MLVESSGFEDIVYQSGTYSSRRLFGVTNGSQYNRLWFAQFIFSESMESALY